MHCWMILRQDIVQMNIGILEISLSLSLSLSFICAKCIHVCSAPECHCVSI